MENNELVTVNTTAIDNVLLDFKELTTVESQQNALQNIGGYLGALGQVGEWTKLERGRVLYGLKKLWKSGVIRPEIVSQYKDFQDWAANQEYVKIKSTSRQSINNWIRVWRVWKSPEATIEPPKTVKIPTGKVDKNNKKILKEVPWNDGDKFTKLLVATGAANKGILNKDCWAAIVDPAQTVEDLGVAIQASRNGVVKNTDPPPDDKIVSFGGLLRIVTDGSYTAIAQWINVDDETASRGRRLILNMLGLKDEPFEIDIDYSAGIDFDGDGARLNLSNGDSVQLSEDEKRNIYEQLKGEYE